MKTLNLNTYNVVELNAEDTKKVDGGWWPFVVTYILLEAAVNPTAHINAFVKGWNEGNAYQ